LELSVGICIVVPHCHQRQSSLVWMGYAIPASAGCRSAMPPYPPSLSSDWFASLERGIGMERSHRNRHWPHQQALPSVELVVDVASPLAAPPVARLSYGCAVTSASLFYSRLTDITVSGSCSRYQTPGGRRRRRGPWPCRQFRPGSCIARASLSTFQSLQLRFQGYQTGFQLNH
jgi:hypothetical protein